jgi:FG-GAP-like repeat
MVTDIDAGAGSSTPFDFAAINGGIEFYAFDGANYGLFRSDGTAAGTIELAANVQTGTGLGVTAPPAGDFSRDFNGDGFSDILWHNDNGQVAIWELKGASQIDGGSLPINPGPSWAEIGAGDFNGDGLSDILFQNTNGQAEVWDMSGTNVIGGGAVNLNPGPSWQAKGTGDFNGDGYSDILLQNANGRTAVWEMNGSTLIGGGSVNLNAGPAWKASGPAISTATVTPTFSCRTRLAARSRSGK